MSLQKAVVLSAVQSATALVCAFVSIKITSVYLGPAGIGVLGQFLLFANLMFGIISSGVNNGVVRWTSQPENDIRSRHQQIATALKLQLGIGLVCGLAIALGAEWLAESILHDQKFTFPFLIFSVSYIAGLVGLTVFGGANANKDYQISTLYSIASSIVGVVLFGVLCPRFGTWGALIGSAVAPLLTAAFALWLVRSRDWWPSRVLMIPMSAEQSRVLLAFVPAAAVSTVGAPLVHLLLRDQLAAQSGLDAVGFVQTITRLSDLYLGVLSTLFLVYYLPRFSEIRKGPELRIEVWRAVRSIVPATFLVGLFLYLTRDLVIQVLLTQAFEPMRELFLWQMTGNVFRVLGNLFGYLITAKLNPGIGLIYQIAMNLLWWIFGVFMIDRSGVIGATQAYAAASAVSAVVGLFAFWWIQRSLAQKDHAP